MYSQRTPLTGTDGRRHGAIPWARRRIGVQRSKDTHPAWNLNRPPACDARIHRAARLLRPAIGRERRAAPAALAPRPRHCSRAGDAVPGRMLPVAPYGSHRGLCPRARPANCKKHAQQFGPPAWPGCAQALGPGKCIAQRTRHPGPGLAGAKPRGASRPRGAPAKRTVRPPGAGGGTSASPSFPAPRNRPA